MDLGLPLVSNKLHNCAQLCRWYDTKRWTSLDCAQLVPWILSVVTVKICDIALQCQDLPSNQTTDLSGLLARILTSLDLRISSKQWMLMQGAWRGRQNAAAALDVVDNFFTAVLSGTLQHDLQSKDLDLPLHSDRAHKLLAENTAAINMSYTVY